ncbi:MAG: potassium/proton antiporter [Rhodospirillales bacterium]
MEFANHLILFASGMIIVSIFAGMISSRFGAPLLLVFLVLGMMAGEDGPGGIDFDDFQTTYILGSAALAIILFDGGLRTRWADLSSVAAPALVLATLGVLVTAAITGVAAHFLLGIGWIEGMLVGSIVASTDAAAVFLLLHLRGLRLRERLRSVLEAEAGINDPMAVLLTVTCVSLLAAPETAFTSDVALEVAADFILQIAGGGAIGIAGGFGLLFVINRVSLSPGLYPLIAVSWALLLFSAAQEIGASGFLAVYLAGLVVGNRRHKATALIDRFLDGLSWLSQIGMFLILGLLVTPSELGAVLLPGLGIALVLTFIARPAAIAMSLPWFRFSARETAFVSWVGLRGAVPIFLATIPVLAGLENAVNYFGIVYVIVLVSLILQGWTIGNVGRRLGIVLPPRPESPPRVAIDLPSDIGRGMSVYAVQPNCLALKRPLNRLPLPGEVDLLSIIRDGIIHAPDRIEQLAPGDEVLLLAPGERLELLDRLFGKPLGGQQAADAEVIGAFPFAGDTAIGSIADAYGFPLPPERHDDSVEAFMRRYIIGRIRAGQRLRLGDVEMVVGETRSGRITRVTIDLDPRPYTLRRFDPVWIWMVETAYPLLPDWWPPRRADFKKWFRRR